MEVPMDEARIAALQRMPIFGGLRPDVLASLVAAAASVAVAKDEFFFREGDKAESMFVLEAGEVAVRKRWDGRDYVLGHLRRGDCFGEMALLDLFPRSASVLAVADCTAIELSTASLFSLYETDLEQFALVQMNIARELSRRLRAADERRFMARVGAPDPGTEPPFLVI
jgi:CRP/FNR family transcriptional regulator, cyclic AMP receptor protein